MNTEGRPQLALRASFPPGQAKENWAILRALSSEVKNELPFNSLAQLRQALVETIPHLAMIDHLPENEWAIENGDGVTDAPFINCLSDHYLTNPIARASQLMAQLSADARARAEPSMAAE